MKILLGLTGSVATVLYEKLIKELQTIGEVEVIVTERAKHFIDHMPNVKVWTDKNEWEWERAGVQFYNGDGIIDNLDNKWRKNDRVLHIELRDNASVLVIAPCSANTLAKISNGICDNLLTSVARAWDLNRPFVIAPAMNTHMWEHSITQQQLKKFRSFGRNNYWVAPQEKMLACNTKGVGALAEIDTIVRTTQDLLRWDFPLHGAWNSGPICNGIPQKGHPGAFLTKRKHHTHTGVDLYTEDGQSVFAVEDGVVVGIENFTGASQNSPWWEETHCVLIEGASGVVCYGEIRVGYGICVGKSVLRGGLVGKVKRVLPLHKHRTDIEGHSTSMLHVEVYKHGTRKAFEEDPTLGALSDWNVLIDPTPFLMNARNRPTKLLV